MKTDRDTRARIAAMVAAEAAFERNPRDPFAALAQTSAETAANYGVEAQAVYVIADGIVVETLVETHLASDTAGNGGTIAAAIRPTNCWRREWDSNPRRREPHRFSRPAP